MKTDFSKFELSKTAMNAIQGGDMQQCHCGGSSDYVYITSDQPLEWNDLDDIMEERCDNAGWGCQPV